MAEPRTPGADLTRGDVTGGLTALMAPGRADDAEQWHPDEPEARTAGLRA